MCYYRLYLLRIGDGICDVVLVAVDGIRVQVDVCHFGSPLYVLYV